MDLNLTLGLIGVSLAVVSLGYAVYVSRQSRREKLLAVEVFPPAPLADIAPHDSGHSLRLLYERPGRATSEISAAYVHYLRFTSIGRIPILRSDVPESDPLRFEIVGRTVLDVRIVSRTRDACQIEVESIEERREKLTARLAFAFLDSGDGALLQVITDSAEVAISLVGSVIGMPRGIVEAPVQRRAQSVTGWGCVIPIILQLALIAAAPIVYYEVTGTWRHVWLLGLPVAAVLVGLVVLFTGMAAADYWGRRGAPKFPEELQPPAWYRFRRDQYDHWTPHRLHNTEHRSPSNEDS